MKNLFKFATLGFVLSISGMQASESEVRPNQTEDLTLSLKMECYAVETFKRVGSQIHADMGSQNLKKDPKKHTDRVEKQTKAMTTAAKLLSEIQNEDAAAKRTYEELKKSLLSVPGSMFRRVVNACKNNFDDDSYDLN